jgi:cbb3-type cytochrome oxidase maturation protein
MLAVPLAMPAMSRPAGGGGHVDLLADCYRQFAAAGDPLALEQGVMTGLAFLIPVALCMGLAGLGAFFWALRSGQFEDMDGAAARILIDEEEVP